MTFKSGMSSLWGLNTALIKRVLFNDIFMLPSTSKSPWLIIDSSGDSNSQQAIN